MKEFLRRSLMRQSRSNQPGTDWRLTVKGRIRVAAVLLVLWAVSIETRLFYLQVIASAALGERAERQQKHTVPAPGKRGDILDRNGRVLATSADADTIYAVPSAISDPQATVVQLCASFADCTDRERQVLVERLGKRNRFAYIRRQVSPEQAQKISALNLEGIGFVKESKRFYPNKELAATLVGYVGVDNTGLHGIEYAYDRLIRGKDGSVLVETDARQHAFNSVERPPTSGSSIELTVDEYLQHVAERELRAGILENRAAGGSAIVLNPKTGEILAMASEPTFNPNAFQESAEEHRRNRAVQDLYEPGSTFKLVTASAAIEEHVMPLDTMIDTSPGYIRVGSNLVHDTQDHGVLSFADVIADSSNVGAIKIGLKVGTDRLSKFVELYGFGRPVSRDFPGESPGIVWDPAKWNEGVLAHVAIGYQVGVTPLQMAAAVGSIANGGQYIEPRLVRAAYRENRRYVVQPTTVRRTVSADTAATLTTIMEAVVDHGTGTPAKIQGFTVAGKTGTAAKLVNNRYSKSEYNVSFVGFVPSRQPALAIIVMVDSPHGTIPHFGGPVAAPIFKRIAESGLRYLGVAPTIDPMPPVLVARHNGAGPFPTTTAETAAPVVSLIADGSADSVPDLRGLSVRDAMRALAKVGLTAHVTGDGFVSLQDPPAGAPLNEAGSVVRLKLDRAALKLAETGVAQP